jgi:hypothetical protein
MHKNGLPMKEDFVAAAAKFLSSGGSQAGGGLGVKDGLHELAGIALPICGGVKQSPNHKGNSDTEISL